MVGVLKNNLEAIDALGDDFYRDTPKSVFALAAIHLAMRAGDDFSFEGARRSLCNEIVALAANERITAAQARAATKVLLEPAEQSA